MLLCEAITLLNIKPDGMYVDCTFGRGGHSRAILECLNKDGSLLSFDCDIEAVNYAKDHIIDKRFNIVHDTFGNIKDRLCKLGINKVDGILVDLGVSSPQLDDSGRGFSFMRDGDLDMRMDILSTSPNAAQLVNTASCDELADILWKYGDERFSKKIASAIVDYRKNHTIKTTTELAQVIKNSLGGMQFGKIHPATKSFQAIRIAVNDEMGQLGNILEDAPKCLNLGGRLAVISFHSLEDGMVKGVFGKLSRPPELPKWVDIRKNVSEVMYKQIGKKIKPSNDEIEQNPRSRSAVLRVLERIA